MKKIKIVLLLVDLLIVVLLSGCGTYMAFEERKDKYHRTVYNGSTFDVWMICSSFTGANIFHHNAPTSGKTWIGNGLGCVWVYGAVPICFLVDLPISIVTDTLAFPYDGYCMLVNETPFYELLDEKTTEEVLKEVKRRTKKGEDINECNNQGTTLLGCAVSKKDTQLVKELIKLGAKPVLCDITHLNNACRNDDIKMVKLLLKHGAKLESSKYELSTPLFYTKNIEIAKILIKAGVNVDYRGPDGETALMKALEIEPLYGSRRTIEMMKLLIDNGANINAVRSSFPENDTILDIAIDLGYPAEIVRFLKDHDGVRYSEIKKREEAIKAEINSCVD